MSEDIVALACPECESTLAPEAKHCPNCGYNLASKAKGVGPVTFTYPEAARAYHPSGIITPGAVLAMLVIGLVVAIVCGAMGYPINYVIAAIVGAATKAKNLLRLLAVPIAFVLYVVSACVLGVIIALVIRKVALKNKVRNIMAPRVVGIICGLAGITAYVVAYLQIMGTAAFNSTIDFFKLGIYSLGIVLIPVFIAEEAIANTPFCETDLCYMKDKSLAKYAIRNERAIYELLTAHDYTGLAAVPVDNQAVGNQVEIEAWLCPNCRDTGFLQAITTQKRFETDTNGKTTTKWHTRRIFSAQLSKEDIEALKDLISPARENLVPA
jgi:hypothetical protein